jgi:hypothetical protein
MVVDSYSEVTWSITNNKRLKFSQYSCPGKRVFGEYPCLTHTKCSLDGRPHVLHCNQVLLSSFTSTSQQSEEDRYGTRYIGVAGRKHLLEDSDGVKPTYTDKYLFLCHFCITALVCTKPELNPCLNQRNRLFTTWAIVKAWYPYRRYTFKVSTLQRTQSMFVTTSQCTFIVILRRVRELLLPLKSNKYYILVCMCAGALACACM